ncbi:MAG: hypothetical protein ABL308_13625 [Oceanicaulis sp.]
MAKNEGRVDPSNKINFEVLWVFLISVLILSAAGFASPLLAMIGLADGEVIQIFETITFFTGFFLTAIWAWVRHLERSAMEEEEEETPKGESRNRSMHDLKNLNAALTFSVYFIGLVFFASSGIHFFDIYQVDFFASGSSQDCDPTFGQVDRLMLMLTGVLTARAGTPIVSIASNYAITQADGATKVAGKINDLKGAVEQLSDPRVQRLRREAWSVIDASELRSMLRPLDEVYDLIDCTTSQPTSPSPGGDAARPTCPKLVILSRPEHLSDFARQIADCEPLRTADEAIVIDSKETARQRAPLWFDARNHDVRTPEKAKELANLLFEGPRSDAQSGFWNLAEPHHEVMSALARIRGASNRSPYALVVVRHTSERPEFTAISAADALFHLASNHGDRSQGTC